MTIVRRLNSKGIEKFREYLHALHGDPKRAPPEILEDSVYSEAVEGKAEIEHRNFQTRMEMATRLTQSLESIDSSTGVENKGLWSWLSLFYFDQVCPPDQQGNRKPGRDYRHIIEKGYRYGHRHLLAGPFMVYEIYGDKGRLLLHGAVNQESMIFHQIVSRQGFITNRGIIEAIDILYFDEQKNKPRRSILSNERQGTLARFIDVIQQLDLTYDLYSMNKREIISLLPAEFNGWRDSLLLET